MKTATFLRRSRFITLALGAVSSLAARAAPIERTTWRGMEAFRLSDGKQEAIIVPAISGRVMSFGTVGGPNWLWNLPAERVTKEGFQNWGGDKTFIGPHPVWGTFATKIWPPDPSWDGPKFRAKITPEGHLKTWGKAWRGFGVQIAREFWFEGGEFCIRQTLKRLEGEPRELSIWNVAQAAPPDAVFVPLNLDSPYKGGFHLFGKFKSAPQTQMSVVSPTLLQITPAPGVAYKIGADSPVSAIIAVKNGQAWRIQSEKPRGEYPEGAQGAGFPVEFYNHSDPPPGQYVELELLSPLRHFAQGSRWVHTVRWSVHVLPSDDVNAPENRAAVESWLVPRS